MENLGAVLDIALPRFIAPEEIESFTCIGRGGFGMLPSPLVYDDRATHSRQPGGLKDA
jgi:hypothetical protein